jgi:hypothetical protein
LLRVALVSPADDLQQKKLTICFVVIAKLNADRNHRQHPGTAAAALIERVLTKLQ